MSKKREMIEAHRKALVLKCLLDADDTIAFEDLCKNIEPLAHSIINEKRNVIPYYGREDYVQMSYIVLWQVLKRLAVKCDAVESFTAYYACALRNKIYGEFRRYVFKYPIFFHNAEIRDSNLISSQVAYYDRYIKSVRDRTNAYRRQYRAENAELMRERERTYWAKNKDKKREKDRRYRMTHAEELREKRAIYAQRYKERKNELARERRAAHLEEERAKEREYYRLHHDEVRAYRIAYDAEHKDKKHEYQKRYYEAHKDEILAKNRERKRKKRAEQKRIINGQGMFAEIE